MKMMFINGSPKRGASNSELLLKRLEGALSKEHEIVYCYPHNTSLSEEQYKEICNADVLVFAFPLYVDAIPSHLLQMMVTLDRYLKKEMQKKIWVYAVVNNGFYEGQQNSIAIDVLKNWCKKCGLNFGQAIGHGAGEILGFVQKVPPGHGPNKNLDHAIQILSQNIIEQRGGENILFSPNFPRNAWRCSAHMFWKSKARENGLDSKEINRQAL